MFVCSKVEKGIISGFWPWCHSVIKRFICVTDFPECMYNKVCRKLNFFTLRKNKMLRMMKVSFKLQNSGSIKLLFSQDTMRVQGFIVLKWFCDDKCQIYRYLDSSLRYQFFSFCFLFPKGGGCWAPQKLTRWWFHPICPLIFIIIIIIFLSSAICGRVWYLLHSCSRLSAALLSLSAHSWWSAQLS